MKANVRLWRNVQRQGRAFSTTPRRLDNYAFIGLGQMVSLLSPLIYHCKPRILTFYQGFQMARNLQSKLSPSDTVRLFDINTDAMEKLAQEMRASKAGGATVRIAETAADAAREAVRFSNTLFRILTLPSI